MIEDNFGDEVCSTGSFLEDEEPLHRSQVLWLLMMANDSEIVTIDGEAFRVLWK